ncbi:MAG: hypothetical protein M1821_002742 [Bathelium mastoideum]|nr:MAG: hypothetical protein M1821_002742 [Bathelium mastoideum]
MAQNTSPSDVIQQIELLTQSQNSKGSAISIPAEEKTKLLNAARDLVEALEAPESRLLSIALASCGQAAVRSAIAMKLFEHVPTDGTSITTEELAKLAGAEKVLVTRIMRALTVQSIFREVGEETYAHNRISKFLNHPTPQATVVGLNSTFAPFHLNLASFITSTGFRNPADPNHTLCQYTNGTQESFFDWIHTQPAKLDVFSAAMKANTEVSRLSTQKAMSTLFPANAVNGHAAGPETDQDVLIVDVGGGRGTVLTDLKEQRPDLKGRMIVQDLAGEVEGRAKEEGVEAMAYDFFQPQPIIGAHTYFFRHVFHDWPDAPCVKILERTVAAMRRGHSRIVVSDIVLPNVGAPTGPVMLDINMMTNGGMERSERQWRKLLEGVGLRIVSLKGAAVGEGTDGLIEAVLA